jgi:DNA-binding transcriptional regulator YhcF (GntR family)
MNEQPELWEELKLENQWFHVVRAMIQRDKIAEMGVYAWAVYCVLKSYAALDTGKSYPGRDAIAKHVGISLDTVDRALTKLDEMGIVARKKLGRSNSYELTEQIPMTAANGEVAMHGEAKYVPMQFQQVLDQLKAFAAIGSMPGGLEVKIVLNANFLTGSHATVNNYNAPAVVGIEVTPKKPD